MEEAQIPHLQQRQGNRIKSTTSPTDHAIVVEITTGGAAVQLRSSLVDECRASQTLRKT
jgi:sRNA-binding protein